MKSLLFPLLFIPSFLFAQDACTGLEKREIFHANQIGATLYPHGYKFFDDDGFFKVPYTSKSSASTIFSSNAWIGGYKENQLKIAAQGFASEQEFDFHVGPLLPGAATLDSSCAHFNRIWMIRRADIESHINDFELDGLIDDTLATVFGWPAEGNPYFHLYNKFSLPSTHQGGWADFVDKNLNGLYEPQEGDYPCIHLNGESYLPERMMWMVYNDQGPHTSSSGEPLGIEIQLTVYGFLCQDNPALNHALFNTYKVINQNDQQLDSVYFGMWTDYDLGCALDDYVGCDTLRHTEFVYNSDGVDGDVDSDCTTGSPTYGEVPPIQSFTYLSHPMSSFVDGKAENFMMPFEYYNLLKGLWNDGTPVTVYDGGYNPGSLYPVTKYLFSGDPRDTAQWSQVSANLTPGDRRSVSSVSLGQLAPYESVRMDGVYIYHQDSSSEHLQTFDFMQAQVDAMIEGYANGNLACTPYEDCQDMDCVWPGDFNRDGISNALDLLTWGIVKDQAGAPRNGLFEWEEYAAEDWTLNLPGDINAKHSDGNGDGFVDERDLEWNIAHFGFTNQHYDGIHDYPAGTDIILTSGPIEENGTIRQFGVVTGKPISNLIGLAYEIEYDTSLFVLRDLISILPSDSNFLSFVQSEYVEEDMYITPGSPFAFVQTDHLPISIDSNYRFQRHLNTAFALRAGINPMDLPDSTIIRLRNLVALDQNGNHLQIGSEPLVVYKEGLVNTQSPTHAETKVFPNPASDFVYVVSGLSATVEIYSLQGQFVLSRAISDSSSQLDVSTLPQGLYILRIPATGETFKLAIQ